MSARRNLLLLEQDMTRLGGPVWVVKAPSKVHGLLRLSSDNLVRSSCKCKYIYIYIWWFPKTNAKSFKSSDHFSIETHFGVPHILGNLYIYVCM